MGETTAVLNVSRAYIKHKPQFATASFWRNILAQNIPMQWDKKEEEEADWLWVKNLAVLWRLGIAALFAKAPWDCTEQTLLICLRGWTKKAQKRWEITLFK
jgi:hypothetical protein